MSTGKKHPHAILLVALNPYRKFDATYEQLCHSIGDRISLEINQVLALAEERKRAEGLAEIDRAKTVFFSNISHEFRTPLTLLLGPIEDALNDPQTILPNRQRLDIAHRNAFRLLNLVNTLLDFSRIEAGRMQASFEYVELDKFTCDLASTFRSAIEKAGLQLKIECDEKVEAYVDIDMWEKIVLNLLSNAFKYTHSGSITARLVKKNDHAEFSVIDTGIGIPENELSNIFTRFHRVQNTGGRSQEGTGIGLAFVQELVKLHHAAIHVTSKLGAGTTFTITLPLGKAHLQPQNIVSQKSGVTISPQAGLFLEEALKWLPVDNKTRAEELAANKKIAGNPSILKPKVLLADDNADVREYVTRLLSNDYEVIAVANGKLALEAAKEMDPDLIVSDVMMPEMDGFELVAQLKDLPRTRQIPVILLSARAGEEATIDGLKAGADDYLVKPFSAKELLSRIDSNIKISNTRTNAFRQLHKIFMDAPVAIAILRGKEQRFELANQSYLEVAGKKDVVGKTLEEVFPEFNNDDIKNLLDTVYTTGVPYIGNEFEVALVRNGKKEIVFFNFVYSPLHEKDETVSGIMVVCVDVTQMVVARKMLEQNEMRLEGVVFERTMALQEANEALKRSNKELEQFAFVTSHDLQEPLRKVRTFATLILDRNREKLEHKSVVYFDKIIMAAQRMSNLVNDLLHFSRLTQPEPFVPVNLNDLFKDLLIDFELIAEEKGAIIEVGGLPAIDAIPLQMNQLFGNLLGNALKFSSGTKKPIIRIESRPATEKDIESHGLSKRPGGYCEFIFADNGIGFDQLYAEKIFEIFQRLNDRGSYEGTGVGLALCSRIVANHQGVIYAEAEENKGATFHIILPVKHQKE